MTHDTHCPSCGHENAAEAAVCIQCNYPLAEPTAEPGASAGRVASRPESGSEPAISMQRIRPIRPRRPGGPGQALQTQLWAVFGGIAVLAVAFGILSAWKEFNKTQTRATIEGAKPEQQVYADSLRGVLAQDSTNVNAQVALGDVLYDTANWPEAILHYRAALRLDPKRSTTMVDLGVCYYNLSQGAPAESLWKQALAQDPGLTQALFNLGFLYENKGELETSLKYYHQAMQGSPGSIAPQLADAIKRVMGKLGRTPPPLAPGAGGMPGSAPPPGGK